MEYYSALKRNEILTHATTQMNVRNVILNEINQSQRDKHCMLLLIWVPRAIYCISQFNHSVMSNALRSHRLRHPRLPCPSATPGACSNLCTSSWWCHPTIWSSAFPFSSAFNLSQHQGLFKWVSSSHQVAKVLELFKTFGVFQLQHQSSQWIFKTDFL